MTTDRTSAAPRPTALAERPSSGSRSAPAPDAFATLLGAHAPAPDARPAARETGRPDVPRGDAPAKADERPAPEQPGAVSDPAPAPDQAQAPAAPDQPTVTPEQLAAQLACPLPAPLQQPAPAAPAVQATPETQPAQPVLAPVAAPAAPVQATAPQQQQPTTPTPQQPVASATPAAPAAPVADDAVASAQPAPPTAPKADDAKLTTAAPAAQQAAPGTGAQVQPDTSDAKQQSQPQAGQPSAPAPTPSTAPVADAPKAPDAAKPAETAPAQPLQAPAPAAPVSASTAAERAVPLYRAPHVAAAVIQLAQERGVTHARINLKPAELGGIEVRLHSTPQGVTAHLIADSPEAAKALHQAGDDLRRQLEARDVNLLSLDVSTSSDDGRGAGFGRDAAGGSPNGSQGSRYGFGDDAEADADTPAETTLLLPDGVLVDVLA